MMAGPGGGERRCVARIACVAARVDWWWRGRRRGDAGDDGADVRGPKDRRRRSKSVRQGAQYICGVRYVRLGLREDAAFPPPPMRHGQTVSDTRVRVVVTRGCEWRGAMTRRKQRSLWLFLLVARTAKLLARHGGASGSECCNATHDSFQVPPCPTPRRNRTGRLNDDDAPRRTT